LYNVSYGEPVISQAFAEAHNFRNRDGSAQDRCGEFLFTFFYAFGNVDFFLTTQQGYGTNLPQIHAHRIITSVA
jgi:hypothetical protein